LENLYRANAAIDLGFRRTDAAEITQAAIAGAAPASRAALDTFCAMLGDVAGNYALGFVRRAEYSSPAGLFHIRDYLPLAISARFEARGG
jgi:glucokinase